MLPPIDADTACGPVVRPVATSTAAAPVLKVEARPPPRLRSFFDCFVPDEGGTDLQAYRDVLRYAEPLNILHYPELLQPSLGSPTLPLVKQEGDQAVGETIAGGALKAEPPLDAKLSYTPVLQQIVRAVQLPEELCALVWAGIPGTVLSRREEKRLRIVSHRRPFPPRPIRRGAKVLALPPSTSASSTLVAGAGTAMKRGRGDGVAVDEAELFAAVKKMKGEYGVEELVEGGAGGAAGKRSAVAGSDDDGERNAEEDDDDDDLSAQLMDNDDDDDNVDSGGDGDGNDGDNYMGDDW